MRRGRFPQWVSMSVAAVAVLSVGGGVMRLAKGDHRGVIIGAVIFWAVILAVSVDGFVNRARMDRGR